MGKIAKFAKGKMKSAPAVATAAPMPAAKAKKTAPVAIPPPAVDVSTEPKVASTQTDRTPITDL